MLSNLITEPLRVEIAGNAYNLQPYSLGMMAKIAKHFEGKGKDGLNYVSEMFLTGSGSSEFIETMIETVYLFIIEPIETIEEFKERVLKKEKKLDGISQILAKLFNEAAPIYKTQDEEQGQEKNTSKKKVIGGLAIILSIIGLISLISWLADMAGRLLNF